MTRGSDPACDEFELFESAACNESEVAGFRRTLRYVTSGMAYWFHGLKAGWRRRGERNSQSLPPIDQVPRTVRLVPEKEPEVIEFGRTDSGETAQRVKTIRRRRR